MRAGGMSLCPTPTQRCASWPSATWRPWAGGFRHRRAEDAEKLPSRTSRGLRPVRARRHRAQGSPAASPPTGARPSSTPDPAALPHLHWGSYVLVHNHEIDDPDIAPMPRCSQPPATRACTWRATTAWARTGSVERPPAALHGQDRRVYAILNAIGPRLQRNARERD